MPRRNARRKRASDQYRHENTSSADDDTLDECRQEGDVAYRVGIHGEIWVIRDEDLKGLDKDAFFHASTQT